MTRSKLPGTRYEFYSRQFGRLMSVHCKACHHERKPTQAFFGVDRRGGATLGGDKASESFRARIANAIEAHYEQEHADHPLMKFLRRRMGGSR